MTHRIHYAARTDRGLLRANNQDSVYAGERLFIVADGMGGHAAGDVASRLVVDAFMPLDDLPLGVDMRRPLVAATREGNAAIAEMVDANPELDGMGTTMTALLFDGANAALAHVGDSRAYLYRNGVLHQISHDDTFVQSLVDDGRITSDEAAHHPQRSLLLRALNGSHMDPRVNLREVSAGDRFLICSDGLSDYVSPESIADALADPEPDQVADTLIQLALVAGGPDNITVIVADVVSTGAEQPPGAAADGDAVPLDPEATGPLQAIHLTQRMPRVPLPAIPEEPAAPAEFAADDEDGDEERDAEADENADGRRRSMITPPRRHVKHRAVWILAVVVVLVAAGLGTVLYARSRYFVSTDAGTVVVFRGVDGSLFGWRFANAVENSCAQTTECSPLQVSDLQQGARDQVGAGIPVNTLADARAVIDRLSSQKLPLCDSLTVPSGLNSTSSPSPTSTASGPALGSPTLLGSGPVVTTLVTVTAGQTPDTVPTTAAATTSSAASTSAASTSEESPSPTSPPQRARLQIPTPPTTARTGRTTVRGSATVRPSTHPSPTPSPTPSPSPTPTTSTVTSTVTVTPTPTPGITLTASPEPGVNCRTGH